MQSSALTKQQSVLSEENSGSPELVIVLYVAIYHCKGLIGQALRSMLDNTCTILSWLQGNCNQDTILFWRQNVVKFHL